jgi:Cu/Zn superoxide dismutase
MPSPFLEKPRLGRARGLSRVLASERERMAASESLRRRMNRAGRFTGVALTITLLAMLALAASAGAEEGQSTKVYPTPIRGSGVSGTATLTDVDEGLEVTLSVQGLPEPDVKHINHIHAGGTCADVQAGRIPPVTVPLKTIVAQQDGTGTATTFVRGVSLDKIFSQYEKRLIIVHAKAKQGGGVPPGISCADLVPLPSTGGIQLQAATLLAGAILALGIATGFAALRRSRRLT